MAYSLNDRVFNGNLSRRDFIWMISAIGAGSALSGCAVDPVTGKRGVVLMSEQQEIAIDQQQSPYQFSSDYGVSQDKALNSYLVGVGEQLAHTTHRPQMPYSFQVVNANYINAYAFPAGSIACTRGIMLELESEDELAGLLGHELGHVNARHAAERQTKGMLAQIAVAGASIAAAQSDPMYGGLAAAAGQFASGALLAHYSRDNEREADALGIEYMARQEYNPTGMQDLMQMLNTQSQHKPSTLELMFSTHPMSSERVANVNKAIEADNYRALTNKPKRSERYMDATASLRKLKPAIDLQQQGEAALQQKDYAGAETALKQSLSKAPNDYTGLVLMSKGLLMQDKMEEAKPYLEKATNVYPEEAQAHQLMGVTALQLKQPERAYDAFAAHNKVLPNPVDQFFMGLSQESMQNKSKAAPHYQAFLQQVQQGDMAMHAYRQLKKWGYIK